MTTFEAVDDLPYLTRDQMAEVDRAMVEDFGIELVQMMENAGRHLAHLARVRFLDGDPRGRPVVVLAGSGGNGGGALVCARWLHNWGARVHVFATKPDAEPAPTTAHQLRILRHMTVPVAGPLPGNEVEPADLIVDGVIGYSLHGPPRGAARDLILWANAQPAPTLALDLPSGLDATYGVTSEPIIRAAATLTLALPKAGLRLPGAADFVGELYLADIGVPPMLYQKPPLRVYTGAIFARSEIVRLPWSSTPEARA